MQEAQWAERMATPEEPDDVRTEERDDDDRDGGLGWAGAAPGDECLSYIWLLESCGGQSRGLVLQESYNDIETQWNELLW